MKHCKLKLKTRGILISAFFIFVALSATAQTDQEKMADLQQQIEQLEEQAQQLRGTITQQREQANTLKNQIVNLKNQIKSLQAQINLTNKKIDKTAIEIKGAQNSIFDIQEKINYRKSSIGQLFILQNRRDNESLVAIVLKNKNLSDFLNQREHSQSLTSSLLNVVSELKSDKQSLEDQQKNLENQRGNLEFLKRQQNSQKFSLSQATDDKNKLLIETKGQEAQYQKMLVGVEQKKALFFNQLQELETRVIQGGLYIVHETATGTLPKKGADLFSWPEEDYRITQGYGCTKYARCGRLRGPYGGAPHNGLDMAAGYGSQIRAIAEGEIIANGKNDGWGNWVAIKHPNRYNLVSVYAHMSSLSFLQVGTQVRTGEVIGYEGNTGNVTGSHLHLSLYKDFFTFIKDVNGQLYFNYFEGSVNPLDYLK